MNPYEKITDMLAHRGAHINGWNDYNKTVLYTACQMGHVDIVRMLIDRDANLEAQDDDNTTALHIACIGGKKKIVKMLVNKGVNLNCEDQNERYLGGYIYLTPLYYACNYGYYSIAEMLVKKGAKIESENHNQQTALHISCSNGHWKILNMLIKKGVNIEAINHKGNTPLHIACKCGDTIIVNILIEKGANIEAIDDEGNTPLHIACIFNKQKIVEILIEQGANIGARNYLQRTALHEAYPDVNICKTLLEKGANINAQDFEQSTVLHIYCSRLYSPPNLIEIFMEYKPNLELKNHHGMSSLMIASYMNKLNICELFLSFGADLMSLNEQNKTALDLYGKGLEDNEMCLSANTKEKCRTTMLNAYLKFKQRKENMDRRIPFIWVLAENNYRSLPHRLVSTTSLDQSIPIEPIVIKTREQKHKYLLSQIFTNEGLVRLIAGFL